MPTTHLHNNCHRREPRNSDPFYPLNSPTIMIRSVLRHEYEPGRFCHEALFVTGADLGFCLAGYSQESVFVGGSCMIPVVTMAMLGGLSAHAWAQNSPPASSLQPPVSLASPDVARDKAVFGNYPDTFKQGLRRQVDPTTRPAEGDQRVLMLDPATINAPKSPGDFTQAWHQPPVSQGLTGQCWDFAATSFLESEVRRVTGREVRFSVAHTWYWEFVEKAREFVRTRGQSAFNRGSEADAVLRIWQQHGALPAEAYRGLPPGQEILQDTPAMREMLAELAARKTRGDWNEEEAVNAIRAILDRHFGRPPESVQIDGAAITPKEYLAKAAGLQLDEYVSVMSFMQEPFDAWCELKVPDNWWHSKRYFNVRLDDFAKVIRHAARQRRTVCLAIDNTEPGFCFREEFAVVPSFDIPAVLIDDGSRQMRFANESTTDDHAVHLVGWHERNGRMWYLIKDSGTRAWNGTHKGYMFYREDYIRLKTLSALLSQDVIEEALGRPIGTPP